MGLFSWLEALNVDFDNFLLIINKIFVKVVYFLKSAEA